MKAEKTTFDEMDLSRYDIINTDEPAFRVKRGLDEPTINPKVEPYPTQPS